MTEFANSGHAQSPDADSQRYNAALAKLHAARKVSGAYSSHLQQCVATKRSRVKAVHALATEDLVRSQTNAKSGERQTKSLLDSVKGHRADVKKPSEEQSSEAVTGETSGYPFGAVDENGKPLKGPFFGEWKGRDSLKVPKPGKDAMAFGSAWSQGLPARNPENDDKFWADLKDCIPCGLDGSWWDGTKGQLVSIEAVWDDLLDILEADMNSRISMFTDLESIFEGNDVLEKLCQIIAMLKNLCPQDLVSIALLITTYINQLLAQIQLNIAGLLQGILSGILRPFIAGLQGFLNGIFGIFLQELECIMNLIISTADATAAALEMIDEKDPAARALRSGAQGMRKFNEDLSKAAGGFSKMISKDIPKAITDMMREAIAGIERGIVEITSALFDALKLDWLKSNSQIGLTGNLKAIATVLNIIEIIIELSNGKSIEELCSDEESILNLIDEINEHSPNQVINTDPGNSPDSHDTGDPGLSNIPIFRLNDGPEFNPRRTPSERPAPDTEGTGTGTGTGRRGQGGDTKYIPFSLKDCMKKPSKGDAEIFSNWIQELGG